MWGIHAKRTGDIGLCKIITETAIAAGIRRIEAITGENAMSWLHQQQALLAQSADLLKSDVNSIVEKSNSYKIKRKSRERIASLKGKKRDASGFRFGEKCGENQ